MNKIKQTFKLLVILSLIVIALAPICYAIGSSLAIDVPVSSLAYAASRNDPEYNTVSANTAYLGSAAYGKDMYSNPTGYGLAVFVEVIDITSDPTGSEQDTSFDLPSTAVVTDVMVNVVTAEATGGTKTMDIGTDGDASNDADGFLNNIDVSSTGLKSSSVTLTGSAYFASTTRGELLATLVAGSGTDDRGLYFEKKDATSGGESVTYTAGSADWAEFRGQIIVCYYLASIS